MPELAAVALAALALASPLPHGFRAIGTGPRGGTIWRGLIRNGALPGYRRETSLYLPPGFSPRRR